MSSSTEMKSILIEDFMNYNWVKKDAEIITYNGVINFARASKKVDRNCVMCGLLERGDNCLIPNQNKDVCRKCDSAYWLMKEFNVVIKFCKGCKTFFSLKDYEEKPEASKCGTCRRRGRDNYHNKKVRHVEALVSPPPAKKVRHDLAHPVKKVQHSISSANIGSGISPQEFCSLVNTMTVEEDEEIDVQTLLEYASHETEGSTCDEFSPDTCTTGYVHTPFPMAGGDGFNLPSDFFCFEKGEDDNMDGDLADIFQWFLETPGSPSLSGTA